MRWRAALGLAVALWVLASCSAGSAAAGPGDLPLRRVADVSMPGHASRFDYQAVDPTTRRLYIAHLGDSTLDVIDLDTNRVVAVVPDLADVHGVTVAPDRQRVYATATGTNQLAVIDSQTNTVVGRVATGTFPDGVTYDPDDAAVYVSNKNDGTLSVIDATTDTAIGTIKLGDETGNVAYDPGTRTIYAAARTPDTLVAVDPATRRVTQRVAVAGCDGAHGVYLDTATQHALVACEHNARLETVDLRTRHVIATAPVGSDPDVLAFDPGLQRLYVASESGTVTILDTTEAVPRKIGQGHLADHAHTVAVDQTTHRVYFPLEHVHGRPTLRITTPKRLP